MLIFQHCWFFSIHVVARQGASNRSRGHRKGTARMPSPSHQQLARRERQIMEIVYRLGQATAADVLAELPDPPSYSAVRAHLQDSGRQGTPPPQP